MALLACLLAGGLVGGVAAVDAPPAQAISSVCPANETELQTDITAAQSGSGTVTFSCGSATQISFTTPIGIAQSVTLDASGSPNPVTLDGGGSTQLFLVSGPATLEVDGLTVAGGDTTGYGNNGGAIDGGAGSTIVVTNSTFSGNAAHSSADGGAVASASGSLTVSESKFSGNSAANCGAIDSDGTTLTITNSTFSGNSAGAFGGGALCVTDGTTAQISGSTLSGNSVSGSAFGGGILLWNGVLGQTVSSNPSATALTITNSTLTANTNPDSGGGAIYNYAGTVTSNADTIAGNSARTNNGGGIYNGGVLNISSTILADNPGWDCVTFGSAATVTDNGYNLTDDSTLCHMISGAINQSGPADLLSTDPRLDPDGLQSNGGPTMTIGLLPGSPAIDAVPTFSGLCQPTDQRGAARPGSGGSSCDIGAFESVEDAIGCPSSAALASDIANAPNDVPNVPNALATVTLSCSSPTTVEFSPTVSPANSGTITVGSTVFLDGSHSPAPITLDGNRDTSFFTVNVGVRFLLDGLTLSHGSSSNYAQGGALTNAGTTTILDSTFESNAAPCNGCYAGALLNTGNLAVSNSTFFGNVSPTGAAIANGLNGYYTGELTLTSSTFSTNSDLGSDQGAALYQAQYPSGSSVTLSGNIFADSPSDNCDIAGGSVTDNGYNLSDDGTCLNGGAGDITGQSPDLTSSLGSYGGPTQTLAPLAGSPLIGAIPASSGLCPTTDQRNYLRHINQCDIGAFETGARPDYGDLPSSGPGLTNVFPNNVTVTTAQSGFPLTVEGQGLEGNDCGPTCSSWYGSVNITFSDGTSGTTPFDHTQGRTASVTVPGDGTATAGVDEMAATPYGDTTSNAEPLYVTPSATTISAFSTADAPNIASVGGTGTGGLGSPWSISAQDTGSGDTGVLNVAEYTSDPSGATIALHTAQDYFDVHLASGTATEVTITDCTPGDGSIWWFNKTVGAWTPSFPTNETTTPGGCVQLMVPNNPAEHPNVADLQGLILAGSTGSPTRAVVTSFRVGRSGDTLVARWHVAENSGIAGFRLYAHGRALDRRVIRVHASRAYIFRTRWTKGPFHLTVLLRTGRTVGVRTG